MQDIRERLKRFVVEEINPRLDDQSIVVTIDKNEGQTKAVLIEPFLKMLGYDEVKDIHREANASYGKKKDMRADYTVSMDGRESILVECKAFGKNLDNEEFETQLSKYYNGLCGKGKKTVAILTNGKKYRLYMDTKTTNVLDVEPYYQFDITGNVSAEHIEHIRLLCKDSFDIDKIRKLAEQEKQVATIRSFIEKELEKPEKLTNWTLDELDKQKTKNNRELYEPLVKKALEQVFSKKAENLSTPADSNDEEQKERKQATDSKKRPKTTFKMLGLKEGDELTCTRKPDIKCKVVSVERNKVKYKGKEHSLSGLATILLEYGKGIIGSGFNCFSYNGKILSDIRKEKGL
ncbi:hypothetical protein RsTz2092_03560 [Deferribacterales bacterium RsTz2092]|nr:hypothetical protein AGMMS49941_03680 [Deferribacterales bacterium]GHU84942.1 hypothetical protein AGMMS49941_03790 [Deferribacterales bacterium]